jgi:hypothetical protein
MVAAAINEDHRGDRRDLARAVHKPRIGSELYDFRHGFNTMVLCSARRYLAIGIRSLRCINRDASTPFVDVCQIASDSRKIGAPRY